MMAQGHIEYRTAAAFTFIINLLGVVSVLNDSRFSYSTCDHLGYWTQI